MVDDESAEAETSKTSSNTKLKQLLGVLRDYKEVVAIVVVFGGGALAVVNYFATEEALERLECFTKINVRMLQASSNVASADQQLKQSRRDLRDETALLHEEQAKNELREAQETQARIEELAASIRTFETTVTDERKAASRALAALTNYSCSVREARPALLESVGAGPL